MYLLGRIILWRGEVRVLILSELRRGLDDRGGGGHRVRTAYIITARYQIPSLS